MGWKDTIVKDSEVLKSSHDVPKSSWKDTITKDEPKEEPGILAQTWDKVKSIPGGVADAASGLYNYGKDTVTGKIPLDEQAERLGTAARGVADMALAPGFAAGQYLSGAEVDPRKPTQQILGAISEDSGKDAENADAKYPGARQLGEAAVVGALPMRGLAEIGASAALGSMTGQAANTGKIQTNETLSDIAAGNVLPVAGKVVSTVGSKANNIVRNRLAKTGDGLGAKYIDNPSAIAEIEMAPARKQDIQRSQTARNLEHETQVQDLEPQVAQQKANVSNQIDEKKTGLDLYKDAAKDTNHEIKGDAYREAGLQSDKIDDLVTAKKYYKDAIDDAMVDFQNTKSEQSRLKIQQLLDKNKEILNNLGEKRDARFKELQGVPATEQLKSAYRELKQSLQNRISPLEQNAKNQALSDLERYLPEEGLDYISQGELLQKIKDSNDKLWQTITIGEGAKLGNVYKKDIASDINATFHHSGDKIVSSITKEMANPVNEQQFIRNAATTRKPVLNIEDGVERSTKTFQPDVGKVSRASPETAQSLKSLGIESDLKKQVATKQQSINDELLKMDETIRAEKQKLDSMQKIDKLKGPVRQQAQDVFDMEQELEKLKKMPPSEQETRLAQLKQTNEASNLADKKAIFAEQVKIDDLDKLSAGKIPTTVSNVVGRVPIVGKPLKYGSKLLSDPITEIKAYNAVKQAFQKPALSAAVKVLTLGGRTLSRAAIANLAAQHNVDPDQLEQTIRENGN